MNPTLALAATLTLVALAAGAGLLVKARATRIRRPDTIAPIDLEAIGGELGEYQGGVVVQFSTAYCSRCPGTQRVISEVLAPWDDVEFLHVDVTDRPKLVSEHRLTQTPTVLIVGADGTVRSRLSGEITRAVFTRELDAVLGGRA